MVLPRFKPAPCFVAIVSLVDAGELLFEQPRQSDLRVELERCEQLRALVVSESVRSFGEHPPKAAHSAVELTTAAIVGKVGGSLSTNSAPHPVSAVVDHPQSGELVEHHARSSHPLLCGAPIGHEAVDHDALDARPHAMAHKGETQLRSCLAAILD